MTETKNLRPKRGVNVPLEDGSPWPAKGKEVALTHYVRRRIADGDVVEATDEEEAEAETPPTPEPETPTEPEPEVQTAPKNSRKPGDK